MCKMSIPREYVYRCAEYIKKHKINVIGKSDKHDLNISKPTIGDIVYVAHGHHLFSLLDIFRQEHPEVYKLNKLGNVYDLPMENVQAPYRNISIPISYPIDGKVWKIDHLLIYSCHEYHINYEDEENLYDSYWEKDEDMSDEEDKINKEVKLLFSLDTTIEEFKKLLTYGFTSMPQYPTKLN